MKRQSPKAFALASALLVVTLSPSMAGAQIRTVKGLPGKFVASSGSQAPARSSITADSPSYTYTLLNYPGQLATFATGINKGATTSKVEIAGGYGLDSGYTEGGFVAHVSGTKTITETYEPVNDPHSTVQWAGTINDLGQIVGSYLDASGYWHGYEKMGGKFTELNIPFAGGFNTTADSINNSDEIVGWYNTTEGEEYGFTLIGGTYTSIGYPGAYYTQLADINNNGDIVGDYADASGVFQGFLLSGGTYTSIDFPGATETFAAGINDSGVIVGVYCPTSGCIETLEGAQGFLLSAGTYTTFAIPGEFYTQPIDINNNGVIVGYYQDAAGVVGSFLATP
jgi:uncharacterized membrane protein